ncbi:MAG: hypothetical protein NW206_01365 [Hyphomonadaceae bacterium]|nr:hypothetical protein [Hyphomonadaceae bacterium]
MTEHFDHALEEEFSEHRETIHRLKISDPSFKTLLERNHALWLQIQNIQNNVTPADDQTRHDLEKQRLVLLDEIAARVGAAES